ncbi:hypothetical protein Tco_1474469 [Tanacetum coccineum]
MLWQSLCHHSVYIRDRPWCTLGYFNSTLFLEDYTSSSSSFNKSMREFKECVEEIEVKDVQRSGLQFTWSQKPKGKDGLLKKIDRIIANVDFNDVFKPLRKLLYEKGNLHTNVTRLRDDLDRAQICLDANPFNVALRENEATAVVAFNDALIMEDRSRIDVVICADGTTVDNEKVVDAFVSHYEQFLGLPGNTSPFYTTNLFSTRLTDDHARDMIRVISRHEIITDDFFAAVNGFFINGKLLKELIHTIIALIPKIRSPSHVTDYRPISCCDVLFKCISKIIANRIKESLKLLVSPYQSAFVPGRSIADNILLTQELMHNYHLDRGPSRCAFKVDIQKAYDTVDWEFLKEVLVGFGFHARMIGWIIECVTTTSFLISINGSHHGFFKGKRWLRQGDPLSPYLFTLVMEILTLLLQRRVRESMVFKTHRYCGKLELINLCFADDLFLFTHGDVDSAIMIKDALEEFKNVSEGQLPVKCLGVPLVSSRLIFRDCKELIERASVFILPSRVLLDIEQLMRGFLWCQGELRKGRAKVAWEVMCLPMDEGGLGIRRLDIFNKALMVTHIWKLLSMKESLWVKWIHTYKLRGRNFWDYPLRGNMSWGWRKILQLRLIIREFIKFKIGDGATASVWFDKRSEGDPLANTVSSRDIFRAGLDFSTKVRDVILHGTWNWPSYLCAKYPNLSMLVVLNIMENTPDRLVWQNVQGIDKPFSVTQVWSSLLPRNLKVPWFDVVWYSYCISRHALTLWLIVKQRLKTQDRIYSWEASSSLLNLFPLCDLQPDSHDHLFFECSFSQHIWNHFKHLAGLGSTIPEMTHIISSIILFANRKSSNSVIAKLVLAASAYFIWQERNNRLFMNNKRTIQQLIECIKSSIWLKLVSCCFKKSKSGVRLAQEWGLPDTCFG